MRHVIIRQFGQPDALTVEPFVAPEPGNRDVMIEVAASGVNFPDLVIRLGIYPESPALPYVPGYEVAGRVVQVGKDVTDFVPGDRVFATIDGGGYATHVVCPSHQLFKMPDAMSDDEASVIATSYLTAWLSVDRLASVRAGETVAVHSAGGGVGLAALQLCLARGARVIAIATESKHARLTFIGADACIDPAKENLAERLRELTGGRGADVILDSTGGKSYQQSYESLGLLGRLVLLGGAGVINEAGASPLQLVRFWHPAMRVEPIALMTANKSISGLHLPALWSRYEICVAGIYEILALYESGQVMPMIDSIFALDDAAEAHRYIHARRNFGKVILRP
ncbi:zinc-binding dehydrogenase [Paraburkholderia sp. D15]|uniref:quinone oxidoreductase family protein n=1 Tax=Paraburkholderia sp. D15 TaxID=2880218 RepID=UPI00247B00F9|nr:zinc-binding dehydrogenase [Paraburkholderia sp. D15]WGS52293.1 zinc-binding dehydrogenase [Paraburkholderia sp. D15]